MSSSMLIPLVAVICIGFLLLCYFRLLDQICFSPNRVGVVSRQHLDDANADVSPQFHSYGLESSIIQSLPIAQFKKKNEAEEGEIKNDFSCAICLGEFEEGEWLRHLPICAHAFHIGCIDTWLQAHSNCPLCRSCVHHLGIHQEYSVYMSSLLETLTREDFFQERATHYQNLRTQILRSAALVHD
ncbi:RING-H2 finger protein ATL16 [Tripterygium wilfordii]|uniref:RING-type E3 ubiquitin transferase n=1 Tax=Tripterygium wilfordii TaxID=458696 RepID=A0A7J7BZX3_TRIWF|nr:RING-H2 finger protein ATL16-like [Tripterygium wilfordii]KAF5727402.1 RING-H2 finger protein ATL16 [Tripterygium wilfordii]